jgi:hypothetical protein
MENSKLVKILKTLSKKELKSFGRLVVSPYFNTSLATAKLFRELKKFYPSFRYKNFKREFLFSRVYGKRRYNEVLFRKLVSNLIKLSEEFLFLKGTYKYRFKSNIYYFLELSERGLNTIYEHEFDISINGLQTLPVVESDYFSLFMEHYLQKSVHYNANNRLVESYESTILASDYRVLDLFIHFCVIRGISNTVNKILNIDFGRTLLLSLGEIMVKRKIPEELKKRFPEHKNIIELFDLYSGRGSKILTQERVVKTKEIFMQSFHRFSSAQKRNFLYELLEQIRLVENISDEQRSKFEYEIYSLMLSENLYSSGDDQRMHVITFVNITNCHIALNMIDEAERFVEMYKSKVAGEFIESAGCYGHARICFTRKRFEDSIKFASNVNLKLVPFCYLARVIIISSYFELKNVDSTLYYIDSFRHFLKTNPIVSDYHYKRFMAFLKYASVITNFLHNKDKVKLQKAVINLGKDKRISSYAWLVEKTNECMAI